MIQKGAGAPDTQDKENEDIDDRNDEQLKTHAKKGTRKTQVSNDVLDLLEQCTNTGECSKAPKESDILPGNVAINDNIKKLQAWWECNVTNCPPDHCYIPSDGPHFALGHEHFEKWAAALVSCPPDLYLPANTLLAER